MEFRHININMLFNIHIIKNQNSSMNSIDRYQIFSSHVNRSIFTHKQASHINILFSLVENVIFADKKKWKTKYSQRENVNSNHGVVYVQSCSIIKCDRKCC